jgi:hypothetical protein
MTTTRKSEKARGTLTLVGRIIIIRPQIRLDVRFRLALVLRQFPDLLLIGLLGIGSVFLEQSRICRTGRQQLRRDDAGSQEEERYVRDGRDDVSPSSRSRMEGGGVGGGRPRGVIDVVCASGNGGQQGRRRRRRRRRGAVGREGRDAMRG